MIYVSTWGNQNKNSQKKKYQRSEQRFGQQGQKKKKVDGHIIINKYLSIITGNTLSSKLPIFERYILFDFNIKKAEFIV
jgi:hypothetical protein